jgi:TetR/AcrR family transcriptional regulator, regulator of cefoperazone and chloramphenicol sensitivity
MARPKQDNPETKARILAAAEDLFAERGVSGTSVREVAERATVNSALVHYYFGSKEGLYRSVFVAVASEVGAMASEVARRGGSASERLRHYVEGFAAFVVTHPNRPRLMMRELIEGAPTLRRAIEEGLEPVHLRVLREIVAEGISAGEFRNVDVQLFPLTVLGMVVQFVIARPLIETAVGPVTYDAAFAARLGRHTADVLLDGVLVVKGTQP